MLQSIRFDLRIRLRIIDLDIEDVDQVGVAIDRLRVEVDKVAVNLKHLRVVWIHGEANLEMCTIFSVIC